jgi:glutathione S-transferase
MMPKPRLITIGVSHYCEKARWALDRAHVEYVEQAHAPILHYGATLLLYRQRTTPLLVTPHGTIRDSTDILRHADRFVPEHERLFPAEEPASREVVELEELFDRKLGPATRRLAYFHIIDDPVLMRRLADETRISPAESALFRWGRVPLTAFLRRGLGIHAEGARRSEERVHEVFDLVEARLAKGGKYLVGDRFTAADLTFAALAAPILAPSEYGWPLPRVEEGPPGLGRLIDRYRSRPAGTFALRLYREERGRSAIPMGGAA